MEINNNENILAAVEAAGGGYVWDAEVFAVTLMDVSPDEELVHALCSLTGVQQIAIEASRLQLESLVRLVTIPGLSSLVLNHSRLTDEDVALLTSIGPEVIQVNE